MYVKNIALMFSLSKTFYIFCFSIYKMVDSAYSMDIFKFVKINIGTVIRNPEMLKFISDSLKN